MLLLETSSKSYPRHQGIRSPKTVETQRVRGTRKEKEMNGRGSQSQRAHGAPWVSCGKRGQSVHVCPAAPPGCVSHTEATLDSEHGARVCPRGTGGHVGRPPVLNVPRL